MATHLRKIRGNPGKRGYNKLEPMPFGDLVDPPDWMTEKQRIGWNYAIENAPRGLLKKLDRSVLAAWVVAEDLHCQASQMVGKFGILTKTPNSGQPMQSPYLPVVNKQAQILLKAAEQLGFSPASRPRVQVAEERTVDEDDNWAEF
ncbi:MAG: phage terminase small subunit P27 family [Acidobacteriia bacterium]|nr:phage terminase small subunit P27 family [Terriglobia bacterium]